MFLKMNVKLSTNTREWINYYPQIYNFIKTGNF